ncbi:MAG: tRNA uridine-5-carboxymethylaminomethyl(34) synthesis GTPase MnmE [Myxococcales bacterium]|nr:MAG: tRNA uridine-5-carboxymethylaminomethyl(34) synthesis GTPase MnmE [Myxococcales bacterium]
MPFTLGDTIAAISTPPGAGGVGVIRLSGPEAVSLLDRLFVPRTPGKPWRAAALTRGRIVDPATDKTLDDVLAVAFRAPRSYTGEDVAEIHAHGGRLNLQQILRLALDHGARAAAPGEFTLRAFLNGRLDLTQAEAVRELIDSQTGAALAASRRHLEGEVTRLCENVREAVLPALAHVEAMIDFPEESIEAAALSEYDAALARASDALDEAAKSYARGRLLHEGVEAVIVGLPNVGKSSLLNRLLRSERAIVADLPGTTRDLIEGVVELAGAPVRFVDTAGVSEAARGVEAIGVERALKKLEHADLILWVVDGSRPLAQDDCRLAARFAGRRAIVVANKSDLPHAFAAEALPPEAALWPRVELSALTGDGLDALEAAIGRTLDVSPADADSLLITSARHEAAFAAAAAALATTRAALTRPPVAWELVAVDLREALAQLEEVVGVTTPDAILEQIFSRFCIGK